MAHVEAKREKSERSHIFFAQKIKKITPLFSFNFRDWGTGTFLAGVDDRNGFVHTHVHTH